MSKGFSSHENQRLPRIRAGAGATVAEGKEVPGAMDLVCGSV